MDEQTHNINCGDLIKFLLDYGLSEDMPGMAESIMNAATVLKRNATSPGQPVRRP